MMVRRIKGEDLWSYIFHEIFPKNRNIVEKTFFEKEIKMRFGSNVKMGPFNGAYEDLFSALNVLVISSDRISITSMGYDKEFVYLYAYVLLLYWDEWYENAQGSDVVSKEEITSEQLKEIGFRFAFGWSEKEEYNVLEHLSDQNLIRMNQQLSPYIIRRLIDEETLIGELYFDMIKKVQFTRDYTR